VPSNVVRHPVASGQGAVFIGQGQIGTITLTAGGAAATVDLRDATVAGGSKYIHEIAAPANQSVPIPLHGLTFTNGVFCQAIAGAGCVLYVELT
jgi:hypothetical protein